MRIGCYRMQLYLCLGIRQVFGKLFKPSLHQWNRDNNYQYLTGWCEVKLNSAYKCLALCSLSRGGLHACVLSHFSCVRLFVTPQTLAHQAPLLMGFSRQQYWSGLPCPSPRNLPDPGFEHTSPALQQYSSPPNHLGSPNLDSIQGKKGCILHNFNRRIRYVSFIFIFLLVTYYFCPVINQLGMLSLC